VSVKSLPPGHAEETRLKKRAASISLGYNVTLTLLKLAAAVLTGSVSLLSEAIHSATDIVASGIAMISVRAAAAPPDEEHPYGHGKIESLAGFGESILLLLIVFYVIFESVQRLIRGSEVQNLDVGVWIMAFSAVTSFLVSRHVHKIAVQSRSLALQSNSQHLLVDCVTSVGVLVALLVAKFTGWTQADPIFAIGLAGWMAFGAWRLSKQAFDQLVDRSLTDEDIKKIHEVVESHPGILSFHRLRTRLSGNMRNIDFHIVVPEEWSVTQAHDVADALEKRIAEGLSPAAVVIHVDPFDATKVAREISENME
jgi:cation diffusion facilitator family transporter